MNVLTGYLAMSSGQAWVAGYDVQKEPMAARKQTGYLPEQPPLYPDMTVREYLRYCTELKGVRREKRKSEIERVIELTAPVRIAHVVLGKMVAAAVMLLLAMGLTVLFPAVISQYAQISAAQMAAVYLGYYLLDLSMLSVGLLVSSLCVNQVTAAVLTLGVNVFLYLSEHYIVPQLNATYLHAVRQALRWLPSSQRLGDFAGGIISLSDVVYYLAFTGLMVFLTCCVIEARRVAKG